MTQADEAVSAKAGGQVTLKTPAQVRGLAFTLGALAISGPFAIDMYLSAFPQLARDLETSPAAVQLTLSLFLCGLALGQIFWGTLSDHVGRRTPLLVGCLLYAGASAACAWAPSIGVLIGARFLMGVGGSAGVVVSRAVVRDLFEKTEAARFYSMMMLIGGIGPIIAPFLGSLLLTCLNWRAIFWTVAVFGVACAAAVRLNVPETLPRQFRQKGRLAELARGYWRVATHRGFMGHALAIGCTAGVLFTYIASSPFVFIQLFGVSPQVFGLCFATNAVGLYAGGQLNRLLLRRFPPQTILIKAALGNSAACLLLVLIAGSGFGGFPAFFGVLFLCLASLALIFPNATAMAMHPFAAEAGRASALLGMLQFALGAAAGSLVGFWHNGTALPMAVWIAACSVCVYLALAWAKGSDPAR